MADKIHWVDQRTFIEQRLRPAIEPHHEAIAEVWQDEDAIAVLVDNPSPVVRLASKRLGWNGRDPVFRLADKRRRQYAKALRETGDGITPAWLTDERDHCRLLVFLDAGSVLVNYSDSDGWSIEPNSTGGAGLS